MLIQIVEVLEFLFYENNYYFWLFNSMYNINYNKYL